MHVTVPYRFFIGAVSANLGDNEKRLLKYALFWDSKSYMLPTKKESKERFGITNMLYSREGHYGKKITRATDDYRYGGHLAEIVLLLGFMNSILVTSIKVESLMCLQHAPFPLDFTMSWEIFLCPL